MSKKQKIVYYVLLVIVSALFLMASSAKLMGQQQAIEGFAVAGLPLWFMYFIGIAELVGVIGLWIPSLQERASEGLFLVLAGAVILSAIFVSIPLALFPLTVAILLGIVVKLRNKKTAGI